MSNIIYQSKVLITNHYSPNTRRRLGIHRGCHLWQDMSIDGFLKEQIIYWWLEIGITQNKLKQLGKRSEAYVVLLRR